MRLFCVVVVNAAVIVVAFKCVFLVVILVLVGVVVPFFVATSTLNASKRKTHCLQWSHSPNSQNTKNETVFIV